MCLAIEIDQHPSNSNSIGSGDDYGNGNGNGKMDTRHISSAEEHERNQVVCRLCGSVC